MSSSNSQAYLEAFQAVLKASPDMITVSTLADGRFIEVNDAYAGISGYSREEVLGRRSSDLDVWARPEDRFPFKEALQRDGVVRGFETLFRTKAGELLRLQLSASLIDLDGEPCVFTIFRDVTEASRSAEALRKAAFLLERAEEMARIGSWEFDYLTKRVEGSEGAAAIYGVPRDNLSVKSMEDIPLPEYRPLLDKARDEHIKLGKPYDIEFKIKRASDGAIVDIHSKALWDAASKRLFGVIRDITEEKRIEEGLRQALSERDALIKELLHRISNTLQVVNSIVEIEEETGPSVTLSVFADRLSRRIRTIALVHRSLLSASDLSRVALREFLPGIGLVLGERSGSLSRIEFESDIDDSRLILDAAVPLGIAVGELLDNAFTVAFPGDRRGSVRLSARRMPDGELQVEVADNGVGLPPGFSLEEGSHVGLMLVSTLVKLQLRGRLECEGSAGCRWRISFRDDGYKARI